MKSQAKRPQPRSLFVVYAALILLLIITALGPMIPVSAVGHFLLAFGISFLKTALIVTIFMEVKYEKSLVRLFASAGLIWLVILFLLTFADFVARS